LLFLNDKPYLLKTNVVKITKKNLQIH